MYINNKTENTPSMKDINESNDDIQIYINKILERKNDDNINQLINELSSKMKLKIKSIEERENRLTESKNKLILLLQNVNEIINNF
jgi:23S rRNA maturation-related 3'-5' exoribonuclease YhaM